MSEQRVWTPRVQELFSKGDRHELRAIMNGERRKVHATAEAAQAEISERLDAAQALMELGGPEAQERVRKLLRRKFGGEGQGLLELFLKQAQAPGLSPEERRSAEEMVERFLRVREERRGVPPAERS